ncbi:MAG: discoidin domain-containing protein [Prevotellaceae bacterium]|nr:discoidin domain-containing protein [Prevotellaceae bacterium]
MKSTNIFGLTGAFCVMALMTMQSCSKMNDLSDRFLDEGSIIYAARADSVAVHPGNGRAELVIYIKTERIDYVRVYWSDDKTLYRDVPVNNLPGVYSVSIELDESAYVFNLVSVDIYGNESLPVEATGTVYGNNFQSSITARSITKIHVSTTAGMTLTWGNSVNYGVANEVIYTNLDNRVVHLTIPFSEKTTWIANWKSGLEYRTLSIPETTAADTFKTPLTVATCPPPVPFVKSNWIIAAKSSEVNGSTENYALNAINGRYDDRWHSGNAFYPNHWMILDFGGVEYVRRFGVMPSKFDEAVVDRRFPKGVQLDVSFDNENWTTVGEYPTVEPQRDVEQWFTLSATVPARYYRFRGTEGAYVEGSTYMVISELDVEQ